ncbi:zinc finger protein GAI-ASSOCIATED FACTOR 1-like [Euphorbia lathyris]|uniref:zinc finger protein GAI-ASSOCIATED FACTOR 1-like n=1 Tax=Euphorbia lathyris TaxID=212925 RepID=UPI003313F102
MLDFVQEFEDDDNQFQNAIVLQSSPENGSTPSSSTSNKKKRNLPGHPDPDAEVVALSPRTLMATNRYICEVCHKGFQRDQNLQLHRRGHNLPWKLKQRPTTQVKKRVYVCPEPSCVHHDPSRALGDLTGIKKHFCRKHGEKKWKCDKCSKRYAVQSDWKAHAKICGTREYRCDCGTVFSRKDSFVTHRAFCDALTEETYKGNQNLGTIPAMSEVQELFGSSIPTAESCSMANHTTYDENIDSSLRPLSLNSTGVMVSSNLNPILNPRNTMACFGSGDGSGISPMGIGSAYTSATALLQKAAEMGAKISDNSIAPILLRGFTGYSISGLNSSGSATVIGSSNIGCPAAANTSSMCVADMDTFDKNLDTGYPRNSYAVSQTGLFESPLGIRSENGNGMEGEVYIGGGEKMTLDFLGVEPTGHSTRVKKRSYEGHVTGIGYSNAHQNLHNMQSDW